MSQEMNLPDQGRRDFFKKVVKTVAATAAFEAVALFTSGCGFSYHNVDGFGNWSDHIKTGGGGGGSSGGGCSGCTSSTGGPDVCSKTCMQSCTSNCTYGCTASCTACTMCTGGQP